MTMDNAPRSNGPHTRAGQPVTQYGGVQSALSRQVLAGALSMKIEDLAQSLDLRVERSFNEVHDCEYAYFETDQDAFTLVKWGPAPNVELYAHIANPDERAGDHSARPELRRFLTLADVGLEDVVFPLASRLEGF
jgi:hypothetical protein